MSLVTNTNQTQKFSDTALAAMAGQTQVVVPVAAANVAGRIVVGQDLNNDGIPDVLQPEIQTRLIASQQPMPMTTLASQQHQAAGSYGPPIVATAVSAMRPTVAPLPTGSSVSLETLYAMATPVALPTITNPALDTSLTAPPRLTAGLPDPASISKQREAYLKALENQERQAVEVLEQQRAQQVALLRAQGDQQKKKFCLEVNQQVSQNDIVLTQQHSEQMMVLNQQYSQQRGILENQANTHIMEYQQKKAQEDMMMQQYQLQVEQHNAQLKYNEEMVSLQGQQEKTKGALTQAYASSYLPPPIAQQKTYLPTVTALGSSPITPMTYSAGIGNYYSPALSA